MPRFLSRGVQIVLDLAVLSIALWLGYLIRFEFALPTYWVKVALVSWPYVVALEYGLLWLFGVPSFSWRYVSMRETSRIALVLAISSMLLVTLRFSLEDAGGALELFGVIPLGTLSANVCFGFLGLVGVRALRRLYGEAQDRRRRGCGRAKTRVLLIGAGEAGVIVARELASRPDLGLQPVGFLDDDQLKHGMQIGGLRVLGPTTRIAEIARFKHVDRVLITIANAAGAEIRRIALACNQAGLDTKIIPGIYEIVGDRVNLSRIREVAIEDLLGREPVTLDEAQVADSLQNAIVMVTGAGGSIGSELCRQVCRFRPAKLVLVERFENALFEIHRELEAAFPDVLLVPRVADVCDRRRMEQIFAEGAPAIVFHAAAHKHVPMMELNPGEAIKNNVGGTRVVAQLADRFEVARFVLISTDKAVNPTSVMGATKRLAEIYTLASGQHSKTRFVTVRFGNVLGSNGSVIPIFRKQLAAGGPLTVTHPEMQRYFMTIPEASQLVIQAGAMGQGGEVFILDMGKPVKIVDLARDLITLSGLRPDEDIQIKFVGIRPGEKLFEELSTDAELADKTKHPKIFIGRVAELAGVEQLVDELLAQVDGLDDATVRSRLKTLLPEYHPSAAALEDEEGTQAPDEGLVATRPDHVDATARDRHPSSLSGSVPAIL